MTSLFSKFTLTKKLLRNGFFILIAVFLVFVFIHIQYFSVVIKPVREDRQAHVYSSVYSYFSSYSSSLFTYYDCLVNVSSTYPVNIMQCDDSLYHYCKFISDSMDNVVATMIDIRPGYISGHKEEFIPSYVNGQFLDQAILPQEQRIFPGRLIEEDEWHSGLRLYLKGPIYSPVCGCNILLVNLPCVDKYGTYAIFSIAVNMDVKNFQLSQDNPYKGGKTYILNEDNQFIFNSETNEDVPAVEWLVDKYGPRVSDMIDKTYEERIPYFTDFITDSLYIFAYYAFDNETIYLYTIPSELLLEDIYDVCKMVILIALAGALIIVLICILNIYLVAKIRARESAIQKDVEAASKIQKSMLEDRSRSCNLYDIDAILVPARHIGGDLYCYVRLDDCLYFCVGDVAGKGITAAMHMSKCVSLFRSIIRNCKTAYDIICQLNREMCINNSECIFVSLFVGVLDLKTGRVNYCNAGHEKPLYWSGKPGDKPYFVNMVSDNIVLGVVDDFEFKTGEFTMEEGSMLIQYTDGVDETINEHGTLFGKDRFLDTFFGGLSDNVRDVNDSIFAGIKTFAGNSEQCDDITLLTIKFKNSL